MIFYNSYKKQSFETIDKLIEQIKQSNKEKEPIFAIVRSKYDSCLNNNDKTEFISDENALEYADKRNLIFCHLSSFEKYETGINYLIETILDEYMKRNNII